MARRLQRAGSMNYLVGCLLGCLVACSTNPASRDASNPSCVVDADCPSNLDHCAYAIADGCSATHGTCIAMPGPPYCEALKENCGCNGTIVFGDGDCFLPAGYTAGPSNGAPLGQCGADAMTD
jgi:hypothetical protein